MVEWVKFGEVCNILNGFAFQSKKYVTNGYRVIRISDVKSGYIDNSDLKFYPFSEYDNYKNYILREGDIVMSLTGNCGRVALIKQDNMPCALNQRVAAIRSSASVNQRFIYFLLNTPSFEEIAMNNAFGAGQKNLSTKWLADYLIPLPSLSDQQKIVSTLDKFEAMVENVEKELNLRQKQYEYCREKWLSDAKGNTKSLGEIGLFTRGNGLQKSDFVETGKPCIHYGQIHTHYGLSAEETISFCSETMWNKLRHAKKGDLLIATTSEDVEACCKATVWMGDDEVAYSTDSFCFSHNQNPLYVAHLFKTNAFADQKRVAATGAKVVRVSGDAMSKFKFTFPPIQTQQQIVSKLDHFESLISNLKQELSLRKKQYEYYREKLLTFE